MYAANVGTFLQRDPLQYRSAMFIEYSHPAVTQQLSVILKSRKFHNRASAYPLPRSSSFDGNLYEYAESRPAVFTDPYGLSVTVITNTDSVGGAGHAGTIVGNPTIGYTYNSYGGDNSSGSGRGWSPCSSAGEQKQKPFKTWEEAMEHAKEQGYDSYFGWNTTPQEDAAAQAEADKWAGHTYNLFWRNCGDAANAQCKAAGKKPKKYWMPTYTDKANQGNADYGGVIK